jgi:hypothetical protein
MQVGGCLPSVEFRRTCKEWVPITRILSRSLESHCTYLSVPNSPYFSQPLHGSSTLAVQFPIPFRVRPTHQMLLGVNLFLTSLITRSTSGQKEGSPSLPFDCTPVPREGYLFEESSRFSG